MNLTRFLNKLFKDDGFVLIDANSREYIVGNPKKKIQLKLDYWIKVCIISCFYCQIYILEKLIQMVH